MESSEVLLLLQLRPGGGVTGARSADSPPEGERPNKKFKGGGKARGKGIVLLIQLENMQQSSG